MNMRYVLSKIDKMRNDWYKPPTNYYDKKYLFEFRSYSRSAIDELKMYLIEHEEGNPITLIEEFRCNMDDFACVAKTPTTNYMFSVYYDVITDILDVLLTEV